MKNHNEMYQSLLSRYNEHQEKKIKRIRTIRRTVPVLACFCLTIALGVGYWDHFRNLPHIPVQPNIIEEPTIERPETTTTASTDANTTISSGTPSEPASTTAATTNSHTDRMTTTASIQTQTTVAVTLFSETQSTITSTVSNICETTASTAIGTTNKISSDTIATTSTTVSIIQTSIATNNNMLSYTLEKLNCSLPEPPSQVSIDPVTGQNMPFVVQTEYDGERWSVVLAEPCEDACIVSGVIIDHILCLSVACLSPPGEYNEETTGFSLCFSDEVNASIIDIRVNRQDFESASAFYEVYTDTPLILNDS
jgi:hypothetical protein